SMLVYPLTALSLLVIFLLPRITKAIPAPLVAIVLVTAKLVDDVTDTRSNKVRESWGQGVANIITGFFGGMGGCAMVGQTMINVNASGARTRISTFTAGVLILILSVTLG